MRQGSVGLGGFVNGVGSFTATSSAQRRLGCGWEWQKMRNSRRWLENKQTRENPNPTPGDEGRVKSKQVSIWISIWISALPGARRLSRSCVCGSNIARWRLNQATVGRVGWAVAQKPLDSPQFHLRLATEPRSSFQSRRRTKMCRNSGPPEQMTSIGMLAARPSHLRSRQPVGNPDSRFQVQKMHCGRGWSLRYLGALLGFPPFPILNKRLWLKSRRCPGPPTPHR